MLPEVSLTPKKAIFWRGNICHVNPRSVCWVENPETQRIFPPLKTKIMDDEEHIDIKEMYNIMLSNSDDIKVFSFHNHTFKQCE